MTAEQTMTVTGTMALTAEVTPVTPAADQAAVCGFEVVFLPADSRVGQMRRITTAHLQDWDLAELSDTATLAVSELVTNAVRHGQGKPVGLRVTSSGHELRIEVTDGSQERARLRYSDQGDEGGRGLLLVDALMDRWGVSPDGTVTWCSIAIPEGRS
ncbi:ATP-binding protein [Streptomyces sp. NBC_00554]|uniref:ATP-binding protein n=1 Tax=Streptomyces sp. NBC_00554 TaxID=2903661 RepID=UPI00352FBE9D|nr:ATP-binding protein [Streptomyces sp. NBC_00554]